MLLVERLIVAAAVFVAAHFAMGFINASAGGSGGSLLFPFATNAPTRWVFGSLDGILGLLVPGRSETAVRYVRAPRGPRSHAVCRLRKAPAERGRKTNSRVRDVAPLVATPAELLVARRQSSPRT